MFRRTTKEEPVPVATEDKGPGAKGRPTPTRKEAEAAARARAKGPQDKKAAQKLTRERRAEQTAKIRQGMRTGDERYLPARDKGQVKRFIRTYVDSRFSVAEFLLPLLVVIMLLSYSGSAQLRGIGNAVWSATILLVAVDSLWLVFRLRKQIREKFPDESTKGVAFYAILRAIQLRPLRQPKPQVRVGGRPKA